MSSPRVTKKRMKACLGWIANRFTFPDTEAFDAVIALIESATPEGIRPICGNCGKKVDGGDCVCVECLRHFTSASRNLKPAPAQDAGIIKCPSCNREINLSIANACECGAHVTNADGSNYIPPAQDEPLNLDDLNLRCELCGEILIPRVDRDADDEIIMIEPCDCILDVQSRQDAKTVSAPRPSVSRGEVEEWWRDKGYAAVEFYGPNRMIGMIDLLKFLKDRLGIEVKDEGGEVTPK